MEYKKSWPDYYNLTRNKPPRPLLLTAIQNVEVKDEALDLGAGALRDTIYLLDQGFTVAAVDAEAQVMEEAKSIKSEKFKIVISKFEDFNFEKNKYDLMAAMYSLPFNPPESFNKVIEDIKQSLKLGGVFCGQFFGDRDEWATNSKMTFHTKEQVEDLLSGMKVILLDEVEKDDYTADGTKKHWHFFNFIAKSGEM